MLGCFVAAIALTVASLVVCLAASSSDAPHLKFGDMLNQGPVLACAPFFIFYAVAGNNLGIPLRAALMLPWRDVEKIKQKVLASHRQRVARLKAAGLGMVSSTNAALSA